jgi:hypothetical protein
VFPWRNGLDGDGVIVIVSQVNENLGGGTLSPLDDLSKKSQWPKQTDAAQQESEGGHSSLRSVTFCERDMFFRWRNLGVNSSNGSIMLELISTSWPPVGPTAN